MAYCSEIVQYHVICLKSKQDWNLVETQVEILGSRAKKGVTRGDIMTGMYKWQLFSGNGVLH